MVSSNPAKMIAWTHPSQKHAAVAAFLVVSKVSVGILSIRTVFLFITFSMDAVFSSLIKRLAKMTYSVHINGCKIGPQLLHMF